MMRRTTITIGGGLYSRLRHEADRRGVSVSEVAREALEDRFADRARPGRLSFTAVGDGDPDDVSERVDEFVAKALVRRSTGTRPAKRPT